MRSWTVLFVFYACFEQFFACPSGEYHPGPDCSFEEICPRVSAHSARLHYCDCWCIPPLVRDTVTDTCVEECPKLLNYHLGLIEEEVGTTSTVSTTVNNVTIEDETKNSMQNDGTGATTNTENIASNTSVAAEEETEVVEERTTSTEKPEWQSINVIPIGYEEITKDKFKSREWFKNQN